MTLLVSVVRQNNSAEQYVADLVRVTPTGIVIYPDDQDADIVRIAGAREVRIIQQP